MRDHGRPDPKGLHRRADSHAPTSPRSSARALRSRKPAAVYKGLCPFHAEKTPSFTVSPTKGFYHCFGCGQHGSAIGFLMAYDNLSFPEAVEALAEMLGMEVPRDTVQADERRGEHDELYALLREADQIYRAALRDEPDRRSPT